MCPKEKEMHPGSLRQSLGEKGLLSAHGLCFQAFAGTAALGRDGESCQRGVTALQVPPSYTPVHPQPPQGRRSRVRADGSRVRPCPKAHKGNSTPNTPKK